MQEGIGTENGDSSSNLVKTFSSGNTSVVDPAFLLRVRNRPPSDKGIIPKSVFKKAISKHCSECWPYNSDCEAGNDCKLYLVRNPAVRRGKTKTTLRRAIRHNCVECVGAKEDICTSPACTLYPYRMFGSILDTTGGKQVHPCPQDN
jgi:hypothetical protein